jgi:SsrA-binding protein
MSDLVFNKKATFNYEITDTIEAGIELFGFEVKSLRLGQGSLDGSYVAIRGGEAFVVGMQVSPFQPKNIPADYNPKRDRRLLLTKEQINSLAGVKLTIVPISVYNSGRKIKVKVGLAQSKKKFDKRETIKKRETDREVRREFRDR